MVTPEPDREERQPAAARLPTPRSCVAFLLIAVAVMVYMLPDLPWTLGLNAKARHLGATLPLFVLMCVAGVMTFRLGHGFRDIERAIMHGIMLALPAILVILVVGGLIGTWLAAGTISTLISVGLEIVSPRYFLPATCLLCSIVSMSCGSSWTTAATIGIALVGIGHTLGIPAGMTAGAIISGAYFGDKMSPLSDTTNLASGIAGADLFDHIRAMVSTTIPSYVIALAIFAAVGMWLDVHALATATDIQAMQDLLGRHQTISYWLLLPPLLVFGLAVMRVAAIPALLAGVIGGMLLARAGQGMPLDQVLLAFLQGFEMHSGDPVIDRLLSGGGVESMLYTVLLIMTATGLGGILEKGRYLEVTLEAIRARVKHASGIILTTLGTSVVSNILLSDQYLAIVLPGRLFRDAYPRFGLAPKMLSRTLEDAGTITSPLIPWNSCGAFMAGTLGVATAQYLPFCFFNLLNPLVAALFASMGWFMFRQDDARR